MAFDTATHPADIARTLIGKRYASNKAFLEGYLLRLGIPIERSSFLEEHRDQVGAWTVRLQAYEISELGHRTDIRAGDLFLQRKGGGNPWRAFIVTESVETRPEYARGRVHSDGTRFIELKNGVVVESEFGLRKPDMHTGTCPNMFRFPVQQTEEQAA